MSGPLRVSAQLLVWEQALEGRKRKHRVLVLLMTHLLWMMYPASLACSVYRTATAADVATFLRVICGFFAMYSSGTAAFLFGRRRHRLLSLLGRARALSERCERACGRTARLAVAVVESAKWTYMASSFFSMWMLVLTLLMAVDFQYRVLCERLAGDSGGEVVLSCSRHLKAVLDLEADMRGVFYGALLHMLAGALLVPLINTYQLMFGPRTLFAGLTLSTLPLVYGSMSLLGDRLAMGCREVGMSAYSGPWTEEATDTQRLRLMILQSCERGAPFAMSGLGGFTRARLYGVLKTWYQYLNLLISSVNKAENS